MAQLLDISPDEYHQRDGLSASIATTLITKSPLHAWQQHPKFGATGKKPTKLMERGDVVHQLVLGKGNGFAILDFDDYKTKAAQTQRDVAHDLNVTPILRRQYDEAVITAAKVTEQLEQRGIVLTGRSEVAIEWHEDSVVGEVLCRGMFDHAWIDDGRILDLKIVSSAAPGSCERSAENFGYGVQSCAYTRALGKLRPALQGRIEFLFAFVEAEPPYAMNLCRGDGVFRELGERRWLRAVNEWAHCLHARHWPAYGTGINQLTAPQWALKNEEYAA